MSVIRCTHFSYHLKTLLLEAECICKPKKLTKVYIYHFAHVLSKFIKITKFNAMLSKPVRVI